MTGCHLFSVAYAVRTKRISFENVVPIRAMEDLSAMDPKFPPDLRPMKRVKLVNGIIHLIQMHFQTTIVSSLVARAYVFEN